MARPPLLHNDREELLGGISDRTIDENDVKRQLTIVFVVLAVIVLNSCAVFTTVFIFGVFTTQQLPTAAPDPIKANQAYHETEFGSVPHTLHVSGFACPMGFQDYLNGFYTFQGKTGDGRGYYAQGRYLLSYDRDCDGDKGGRNDCFGEWRFNSTPMTQMDGGGSAANAFLQMAAHPEKYTEIKPYQDFSQPPGALPPAVHKWRVWCGKYEDDDGWAVQTLHIRAYPAVLGVQGLWQFVKTAMPKEKIKLKHGKSKTTIEGGEWEVSGSTSVKLGGTVGFLDFGEASAEASTEVGGRLQHMWETEVESTSKKTVEFELPEDKGSALWQWVLIAKGKETGFVKTEQYAFTASGTGKDRPKCFPGGSKDGYRYQECHDGWEIPRAPSDQAPFQSAQHH